MKYWAAVVQLATRMFSCARVAESLQARARVLGALSLVAVRETHDEPRLAHLACPLTMNWSINRLADVGEVPYWASHKPTLLSVQRVAESNRIPRSPRAGCCAR